MLSTETDIKLNQQYFEDIITKIEPDIIKHNTKQL